MEGNAVIKLFGGEPLDLGGMSRGEIGPHFDDDRTLGRLQSERVSGLSHFKLLVVRLKALSYRRSAARNSAAGAGVFVEGGRTLAGKAGSLSFAGEYPLSNFSAICIQGLGHRPPTPPRACDNLTNAAAPLEWCQVLPLGLRTKQIAAVRPPRERRNGPQNRPNCGHLRCLPLAVRLGGHPQTHCRSNEIDRSRSSRARDRSRHPPDRRGRRFVLMEHRSRLCGCFRQNLFQNKSLEPSSARNRAGRGSCRNLDHPNSRISCHAVLQRVSAPAELRRLRWYWIKPHLYRFTIAVVA